MPKLEEAGGFKKGDRVTVAGKESRSVNESRGSFDVHAAATVAWCYESDVSPGDEFVYITMDDHIGHHPRTCPVTGGTVKGDPIFGPFAFRPSDLAHMKKA